jgi:hypothetical protein
LKTLINGWISAYGPPQIISCDADVRWKNQRGWTHSALDRLGITLRVGAPYSKNSNAPAERSNRKVLEAIRCVLAGSKSRDWTTAVGPAIVGCNATPSQSRHQTPQFLFLGNEGNLGPGGKRTENSELLGGPGRGWASTWLQAITVAQRGAQRLRNLKLKRKHTLPSDWRVGDLALVHPSRFRPTGSDKLDRWHGPYEVLNVDGRRATLKVDRRQGGTTIVDHKQLKKWPTDVEIVDAEAAPQAELQATDPTDMEEDDVIDEDVQPGEDPAEPAMKGRIVDCKFDKGWKWKVVPDDDGGAEWLAFKDMTEADIVQAIELCEAKGWSRIGAALEEKIAEQEVPPPGRHRHHPTCTCRHCRYREGRQVALWNKYPKETCGCSSCKKA